MTIDKFLKHYNVFERYITKQLQQNFDFNNFTDTFTKIFKNVKTKIHVEALLKIKITSQIVVVVVARKKCNNNNKRINHYDALTFKNVRNKIKTRSQIELLQKKIRKSAKISKTSKLDVKTLQR